MCVFLSISVSFLGEETIRKRRSSVTGDASARALHFAFMQGTAGLGTSNDTKLPVPVIKKRGLLNIPK